MADTTNESFNPQPSIGVEIFNSISEFLSAFDEIQGSSKIRFHIMNVTHNLRDAGVKYLWIAKPQINPEIILGVWDYNPLIDFGKLHPQLIDTTSNALTMMRNQLCVELFLSACLSGSEHWNHLLKYLSISSDGDVGKVWCINLTNR